MDPIAATEEPSPREPGRRTLRRRVLLLLLVPLALGAALSERPASPVPADVVLVVVDTLRADHLPIAGYHRETSPNVERLARDGVVYERAVSPGTWTVASHASMFTGLWPSFHGAERVPGKETTARPMRREVRTLAEILRAEGFHTAAFVGNNAFVARAFGFDRGFEEFRNDDALAFPPKLAEEVAQWIERQTDRLFLFVNVLDPHEPYDPLPPLDTRFPTKQPDLGSSMTVAVDSGMPVEPRMQAHFVSQYDAEVVVADRAVGAVVNTLVRTGRYDDALVVVTSDHGELLGEHGLAGHGQLPYEPEVHVPLVVKWPRQWRAGERVRRRVSTRALFETILASLGIPPPTGVDGRGLDDPHRVWIEDVDSSGNRILAGYGSDGAKVIDVTTSDGLVYSELYDLGASPGETERVEDDGVSGALRFEARAFAALPRPANDQVPPAIDPERESQLRALGYVR
ncbi:sulfatase [bacterium]|nr:sulfatase [bacterium]